MGNSFVATIIHPSFNSSGAVRAAQIAKDPQTGRAANVYSINVSRYLSIPVQKGEAIMGQEKAQVGVLFFAFLLLL